MKLLLSAAVAIAILFCLFSRPFIYSPSVYFSSTVHKNYIFLLCNGILLLLVQSSGRLVSDFPVDSYCREAMTAKNGNREKTTSPSFETVKEEIKTFVEIEDVEETENTLSSSPIVEENEVLIELDGEEGLRLILFEEEEEEDERRYEAGAYVAGMMSREELNKKCDDFISKMKEAIHSEMHRLIL